MKHPSAILIFLISASVVIGCSPQSGKPYDRALVITYAELTLLYEKEKMTEKEADSLYQISVKEFFARRGYEQEKFRNVIQELSEYPDAWKMFLQDVTTAMDSLRNDAEKKALKTPPGKDSSAQSSTALPRR